MDDKSYHCTAPSICVNTQFLEKPFLFSTVCPTSSDPYYIMKILYKMGHYFLDKQYLKIQETFPNFVGVGGGMIYLLYVTIFGIC